MAKRTSGKAPPKKKKPPTAQLLAFARRVLESRESAGLTQRKLAERLDMEPVLISRYERAASYPKHMGTMAKLAVALGCSVEWLATGRGKREAA